MEKKTQSLTRFSQINLWIVDRNFLHVSCFALLDDRTVGGGVTKWSEVAGSSHRRRGERSAARQRHGTQVRSAT